MHEECNCLVCNLECQALGCEPTQGLAHCHRSQAPILLLGSKQDGPAEVGCHLLGHAARRHEVHEPGEVPQGGCPTRVSPASLRCSPHRPEGPGWPAPEPCASSLSLPLPHLWPLPTVMQPPKPAIECRGLSPAWLPSHPLLARLGQQDTLGKQEVELEPGLSLAGSLTTASTVPPGS